MPYKKIYDPIHQFIYINELENELIDSIPFRRLQSIHQLGVAYLVYPGATHTRFEHSLGTMEIASRIYDQITSSLELLGNLDNFDIPAQGSFDDLYFRKIVRLAALCHDMGHLPFSHAAEKALLGDNGHEHWTLKIIHSRYLEPIWRKLQLECVSHGKDCDVTADVTKIALGEAKLKQLDGEYLDTPLTPWEKILSEIITNNFFGADRIDYLLRDAKYSGLAYGSFDYDQLITTLRILPSFDGKRMVLGATENGIESCESLLLARYFMHKRIYQYESTKAYNFHLQRFMHTVYADHPMLYDIEPYLTMTDHEVMLDIKNAAKDSSHQAHLDAQTLLMQRPRFVAIPIKEKTPLKLDIPEHCIAWDLAEAPKSELSLAFPVLRKFGNIEEGRNLSQISIPSEARSWIYTDSKYELPLRQHLKLSM